MSNLNARKKRALKKAQEKETFKEKWCSSEGEFFGYHGSYTGTHCPKCKDLRNPDTIKKT